MKADANETKRLEEFDNIIYQESKNDPRDYTYGSYFVYKLDTNKHQYQVASLINSTSQDAPGIYPALLYEAVLRLALEDKYDKPYNFKMSAVPHPIPEFIRVTENLADAIFLSFMVSIAFAMIPAAIIAYTLAERNSGVKHQ